MLKVCTFATIVRIYRPSMRSAREHRKLVDVSGIFGAAKMLQ